MYAQSQTINPETIRNNRKEMRLNIKRLNVKSLGPSFGTFLKPEPETQVPPGIRRRRKTSENIKDFDYMSVFKDQTVEKDFENFF